MDWIGLDWIGLELGGSLANAGPGAIREVSSGIETYCPQLDLDLEDLAFADLGALAIPHGAPEPVLAAVEQATSSVLELGLAPLMLGGEHSISSGAVAAVARRYPPLVLVQLEAGDARAGHVRVGIRVVPDERR